ncbi:hypothetical protein M446_0205 [Methylobacterium sp. 4-46]|nr:hypothetical protein M446_0205 [Methylobacterium sp. 4-46]
MSSEANRDRRTGRSTSITVPDGQDGASLRGGAVTGRRRNDLISAREVLAVAPRGAAQHPRHAADGQKIRVDDELGHQVTATPIRHAAE